MDPFKQYPFLTDLLKPFFRRNQKTMGVVIVGIAAAGQARSFAIGTCLATWAKTRLDSAVNRFYRLLRNTRIDYTEFVESWAKLLAKPHQGRILVAIDWTEWHHDIRMLVAAVVVGKRALPLFAQAFEKKIRDRSQNTRENTFLRVLADALKQAGVTAIFLCDRGFRRVSWIELLQRLHQGFVIRLVNDVFVDYQGQSLPLSKIKLTPGKALDLGVVPLRSDAAVHVRVIGFLAKGAKEAWWVATSENGRATHVLKLYDRRMTVEEQFRDNKGKRFGVKLFWTQFRDPEALARFMMLLAVAMLIWTLNGVRASYYQPHLRMVCKKKGPRQSYITIGLRIVTADPTSLVLTIAMIRRWLEPPTKRALRAHGFGAAK